MTAPEPLTLTLEEAAQLLGEQGLVLILDGASGAASRWSVRPWSAPRDWMREELGATWPEVVGAARGRPVMARDEAAELRAAVKLYLARLDDYEADQYPRGSIARLKKNKALKALRAALAASEGQS